jgi:adenylate cyclase
MLRGYMERTDELWSRSIDAIHRAHSLDAENPECHRLLCEVYLLRRDFEKVEFHQERALALNPNDPRLVVQRGFVLAWVGRGEEGVPWVEKAMRLDPNHPEAYYSNLGLVRHEARRYREATEALKRMPAPQVQQHATMASCYGWMGEDAAATAQAAAILALKPEFTAAAHTADLPYKNEADREHHRQGLLKAGLPD